MLTSIAFPDIHIKAKNHFHFNMSTIFTVQLLDFKGKQEIVLPKYILLSPFFQAHDNSVKNDRNNSNRLRHTEVKWMVDPTKGSQMKKKAKH